MGIDPPSAGRRDGCESPASSRAFSLIELLVVMAIITVLGGMVILLPKSDQRDADVRTAAEELAATLRSARALAMRQASFTGVSFNLRNGAGTTGKVLNNWDGGHWYRIIGPSEFSSFSSGSAAFHTASYPRATSFGGKDYATSTLSGFIETVERSWVGDRHQLAAKRVRFLAVSDQDNGTVVDPTSNALPGNRGQFPATYPRPWFGYWSGGRLYSWGGYDATLTDLRGQFSSGFCFQGKDGPITGCLNPVDRSTTFEGGGAGTSRLLAKDKGRDLLNGDWLDYVLRFSPDGSVDEAPIMEARYTSYSDRGPAGTSGSGGGIDPFGDLGDRCAMGWATTGVHNAWHQTAMTSYVRHTGGYAITLCPDILLDTDQFATARLAMESLMPAYRVVVSRAGVVEVVKVKAYQPNGTTYDTTLATADFVNQVKLKVHYRFCYATRPDTSPRGMPVTDFMTPELLLSRNWWMTAP